MRVQKEARSVRSVFQGQAFPQIIQAGVILNERRFRYFKKLRQTRDVLRREPDLALNSAAIPAALAYKTIHSPDHGEGRAVWPTFFDCRLASPNRNLRGRWKHHL